jgi:hypothetical protein
VGSSYPTRRQEKPTEAEVVAPGPAARDEQGKIVPLEVKPGDKVPFGKWPGTGADALSWVYRCRGAASPPAIRDPILVDREPVLVTRTWGPRFDIV